MPSKVNKLVFFTILMAVGATKCVAAADITPPVTTYVQTPASPDGKAGWYVSPVKFDLTATDLESGVKEIRYRVDAGTWQIVSFINSLNLAPNPSMEIAGGNSGVESWNALPTSAGTTYSQDITTFLTGYETASAKIVTTDTGWHGINNQSQYSVSTSYDNMTASAWLKTDGITGTAYFRVYAIIRDAYGVDTYQEVAQSTTVTGTVDWTKVSANFVVNSANVVGVYLDIGLDGPGTLWLDAVSISTGAVPTTTTFTVGSDSSSHTVAFYSVDVAGNVEGYSCSSPTYHCVTFKLDQTPPGNWHDSGAFRGLFGSNHELYVYTNVQDPTSGISTFTDKYQYLTVRNPTFGRFQSLIGCSTSWQENSSVILISPPFLPGVHTAYLLTPKTDFCDSNWKICKVVRFMAEDLAGNTSYKDHCINGPWIRLRGEGLVRSNKNINMISEPDVDNTDGVIEVQGTAVDYFTSTRDWIVRESPIPDYASYQELLDLTKNPTSITDGQLTKTSGVYKITGDFTIDNQALPSQFSSTTFNQIVFISGDLTIETELTINSSSTLLFVVEGNANIAKAVNNVHAGILADGDISTAYDIAEGDATNTLLLKGIFSAAKFNFQRTLQGTNNSNTPSDDFTFEPKYLVQLKDYFGKYSVTWKAVR